jgi:hypothetical protein
MKRKLIIWIIAFILLVGTVNALGITPGRNTLNFEPGMTGIKIVKVTNDGSYLNLAVYIQGDLKDYLKVNETEIKMAPDRQEAYVEINYLLPEELPAGARSADIIFRDIGFEENGTLTIGAKLAVVSQFIVNVPYGGKFAEAELSVLTKSDHVGFYTRVFNRGGDDLDVEVTYKVLDLNNKEIDEIEMPERTIAAQSRDQFVIKWNPHTVAGDYKVRSIVKYAGEVIELEEEFTLQGEVIKPLAVSVEDFNLGAIAKLNILVENIGGSNLEDVSAQFIMEDSNGNEVANERSLPVKLGKGDKGELIVYWDTKDLVAGVYRGKLILKVKDWSVTKELVANVAQNNIDFSFDSVTGFAVSTEVPNADKVVLIPILIGALILVNIIWFIVYRRRKKVEKSL